MTKPTLSKIITILLTAAIALAAVFGYDIGVIQPRETNAVILAQTPGALTVDRSRDGVIAPPWLPPIIVGETTTAESTTNLSDLAVNSLTVSGLVSADSLTVSGAVSAADLTVSSAVSATDLTVSRAISTTGLTATDDLLVTGDVTLSSLLIQSSTSVTLTAGLTITPAYTMYMLDSSGAVSMTLAPPTAAGQTLYLFGNDNNTITINDTNVRTSTGNAITLGQYDVVQWISTATEWIEVALLADS